MGVAVKVEVGVLVKVGVVVKVGVWVGLGVFVMVGVLVGVAVGTGRGTVGLLLLILQDCKNNKIAMKLDIKQMKMFFFKSVAPL